MIRQTLLRGTQSSLRSRATTLVARRYVGTAIAGGDISKSLPKDTTHALTNASGVPSLQVRKEQGLAPGEEIDPQYDFNNPPFEGERRQNDGNEKVDHPLTAVNGYPQLPWVHFGEKPPLGWWDNQSKRNFGETLHEEADILGPWGPDLHTRSGTSALAGILTALGGLALFAYGLSFTVPEIPVVRREYPFNGLEKELGGYPTRAYSPEEDDE